VSQTVSSGMSLLQTLLGCAVRVARLATADASLQGPLAQLCLMAYVASESLCVCISKAPSARSALNLFERGAFASLAVAVAVLASTERHASLTPDTQTAVSSARRAVLAVVAAAMGHRGVLTPGSAGSLSDGVELISQAIAEREGEAKRSRAEQGPPSAEATSKPSELSALWAVVSTTILRPPTSSGEDAALADGLPIPSTLGPLSDSAVSAIGLVDCSVASVVGSLLIVPWAAKAGMFGPCIADALLVPSESLSSSWAQVMGDEWAASEEIAAAVTDPSPASLTAAPVLVNPKDEASKLWECSLATMVWATAVSHALRPSAASPPVVRAQIGCVASLSTLVLATGFWTPDLDRAPFPQSAAIHSLLGAASRLLSPGQTTPVAVVVNRMLAVDPSHLFSRGILSAALAFCATDTIAAASSWQAVVARLSRLRALSASVVVLVDACRELLTSRVSLRSLSEACLCPSSVAALATVIRRAPQAQAVSAVKTWVRAIETSFGHPVSSSGVAPLLSASGPIAEAESRSAEWTPLSGGDKRRKSKRQRDEGTGSVDSAGLVEFQCLLLRVGVVLLQQIPANASTAKDVEPLLSTLQRVVFQHSSLTDYPPLAQAALALLAVLTDLSVGMVSATHLSALSSTAKPDPAALLTAAWLPSSPDASSVPLTDLVAQCPPDAVEVFVVLQQRTRLATALGVSLPELDARFSRCVSRPDQATLVASSSVSVCGPHHHVPMVPSSSAAPAFFQAQASLAMLQTFREASSLTEAASLAEAASSLEHKVASKGWQSSKVLALCDKVMEQVGHLSSTPKGAVSDAAACLVTFAPDALATIAKPFCCACVIATLASGRDAPALHGIRVVLASGELLSAAWANALLRVAVLTGLRDGSVRSAASIAAAVAVASEGTFEPPAAWSSAPDMDMLDAVILAANTARPGSVESARCSETARPLVDGCGSDPSKKSFKSLLATIDTHAAGVGACSELREAVVEFEHLLEVATLLLRHSYKASKVVDKAMKAIASVVGLGLPCERLRQWLLRVAEPLEAASSASLLQHVGGESVSHKVLGCAIVELYSDPTSLTVSDKTAAATSVLEALPSLLAGLEAFAHDIVVDVPGARACLLETVSHVFAQPLLFKLPARDISTLLGAFAPLLRQARPVESPLFLAACRALGSLAKHRSTSLVAMVASLAPLATTLVDRCFEAELSSSDLATRGAAVSRALEALAATKLAPPCVAALVTFAAVLAEHPLPSEMREALAPGMFACVSVTDKQALSHINASLAHRPAVRSALSSLRKSLEAEFRFRGQA
jgi:hypothetical protein